MLNVLTPDKAVHGPVSMALSPPIKTYSKIALDQYAYSLPWQKDTMWCPVRDMSEIPTDRDLRLAVLDGDAVHALVFPCRRHGKTWANAKTGQLVEVIPTHWQEWQQDTNRP